MQGMTSVWIGFAMSSFKTFICVYLYSNGVSHDAHYTLKEYCSNDRDNDGAISFLKLCYMLLRDDWRFWGGRLDGGGPFPDRTGDPAIMSRLL